MSRRRWRARVTSSPRRLPSAPTFAPSSAMRSGARGTFVCRAVPEKTKEPTQKFEMYYTIFREQLARRSPPTAFWPFRRGRVEGDAAVAPSEEWRRNRPLQRAAAILRHHAAFSVRRACASRYRRRDGPQLDLPTASKTGVCVEAKLAADIATRSVSSRRTCASCCSPPAARARRVVLGIDPGQRTGCKCVVVDDTGKLRDHQLINLDAGRGRVGACQEKSSPRFSIITPTPSPSATGPTVARRPTFVAIFSKSWGGWEGDCRPRQRVGRVRVFRERRRPRRVPRSRLDRVRGAISIARGACRIAGSENSSRSTPRPSASARNTSTTSTSRCSKLQEVVEAASMPSASSSTWRALRFAKVAGSALRWPRDREASRRTARFDQRRDLSR